MRRRVRFFYFSDETLGVHEIRGFRMKFTAFVFGAILVALSAIVVVLVRGRAPLHGT